MRKQSITKAEHLYVAIVLVSVSIPYIMNNTGIGAALGEGLFAYVLKGILWLLPAYVCWRIPRNRSHTKLRLLNNLRWMAFFLGAFQIVFMVAGGMYDRRFGKSPYLFTPIGILTNLLLVGSALLGTETARSYLISVYSKRIASLAIAAVSVLFTVTSLPLHRLLSLESDQKMVEYAGKIILPSLAESTAASYLAAMGGPVTSIAYRGLLQAFHWFSPVLPDAGVLTSALVGTVVPLLGITMVQNLYASESREIKRREKAKENTLGWIASSVFSVLIVWFAVGVFPVYPSVVATGSMEPMIKPGDVILVRKIDSASVGLGDVVQYRLDGNDITHRVIGVQDGEKRSFQMQGDANPVPDSKLVEPQQIRGRIIGRIPKVGWLTLVLRGGVTDSGARTF